MQKHQKELQSNKAAAIAVILSAVLFIFAVSSPFVAAVYMKNTRRTIVIDAGHGGFDGGVTGTVTGVKESELNLTVSKLVVEYLVSSGFRVIQTRTNNHALYSDNSDNKKRDDMYKRARIINSAQPAAVVSIHMNFYKASYRRGAQVFFNRKNEQSRNFGDTMQDFLNERINKANGGREYSALHADKYLLECTQAPVIIVECGFLSNPQDEANLINPEYQAILAYAVFQGIAAFLSNG